MFKSLAKWWKGEDTSEAPDTVHEELAPDKPRATRRTFSQLYPRESWLDLLVEDNPKRKNTRAWEKYELYRKANSVGEALELGIPYLDTSGLLTSEDYWLLDGHWRESGHRKVATELMHRMVATK